MNFTSDIFGDDDYSAAAATTTIAKVLQVFTFVPLLIPILLLCLIVAIVAWRIQIAEYNYPDFSFSTSLSRVHAWQPFSYAPQPKYCSGCSQLISGFVLFRNMGHECRICGICAHLSCIRTCEKMSCKNSGRLVPLTHQLKEGNLNNNSVCTFCGVVCSSAFSLYGLECLWCHCTFHETCLERAKEAGQFQATTCDLGQLRHLILPPSALCPVLPPKPPERRVHMSSFAKKTDGGNRPAHLELKDVQTESTIAAARTQTESSPMLTRSTSAPSVTELLKGEEEARERSQPSLDIPKIGRAKDDSEYYGQKPLSDAARQALLSQWKQSRREGLARTVKDMIFGSPHQGMTSDTTSVSKKPPPVFHCRKPSQWRLVGFPVDSVADPCYTWTSIISSFIKLVAVAPHDVAGPLPASPHEPVPTTPPPPSGIGMDTTAVISSPIDERLIIEDGKKEKSAFLSLDSARNLTETLSTFAMQHLGRSAKGPPPAEVAAKTQEDTELEFCDAVFRLHQATSTLMLELERLGTSPTIVFVNPKSGGRLGYQIIREFYTYLNPWQVVDMLLEKNPEDSLRRFAGLAITGRMTILACGGDGTVSWIIDSVCREYATVPSFATLAKLNQVCQAWVRRRSGGGTLAQLVSRISFQSARAPVAVLPLGTGNDLAKILNWGSNFDSSQELVPFMRRLVFGREVALDLWNIEIYMPGSVQQQPRSRFSRRKTLAEGASSAASTTGTSSESTGGGGTTGEGEELISRRMFTNYVDFGIAARIALKFHGLRETHPELFRSRLGNKFLYGEVGVRDYLVDLPIDLNGTEIYCDGNLVDLAPHGNLEGIAIVNIPSFGGGVEPWKGVVGGGMSSSSGPPSGGSGSGTSGIPPRLSRSASGKATRRSGKGKSGLVRRKSDSPASDFPRRKKPRLIATDSPPNSEPGIAGLAPQKMNDQRIEIIGFRSLLHLGRVQVGMADSIKIAQGSEIILKLKHKVPYQIDGEPQTLNPCTVRITWRSQTSVLSFSAPVTYQKIKPKGPTRRLPPHPVPCLAADQQKRIISTENVQQVLQESVDAEEITEWQAMLLFQRFRD